MSNRDKPDARLRDAMVALGKLEYALEALRSARPRGPSGMTRYYSIVITMTEKALAYFKVFIVDELEKTVRGRGR